VTPVLYVYAIARAEHPLPETVEAVDGSEHVAIVQADSLGAIYSGVDAVDFSQAVIDARSKDVEWLGAIGYRHQAVMSQLMKGGTIIPLRAFTLFGAESSLRAHIQKQQERYARLLDRLEAKGLVRRVRSSEDRRVVNLELTDEGHEAARNVPAVLCRVQNAALRGFSTDEWQQLRDLLARMLRNSQDLHGKPEASS